MSDWSFLSPQEARASGGFEPRPVSPLARALTHSPSLRDLSLEPKLEVRGEIDAVDFPSGAEVVRVAPRRALVLGAASRAALEDAGYFVTDTTAALAGLELEGLELMRRLTELDLDALPAVGSVAHVQTVVLRDGDRFRLFFPQEYGLYLAEVIVDAAEGLAA
jgi:hypothetical protein